MMKQPVTFTTRVPQGKVSPTRWPTILATKKRSGVPTMAPALTSAPPIRRSIRCSPIRYPPSDFPWRRRELLDQEIDEGRHLGREMAAVRIDGVNGQGLFRGEIRQQRYQTTGPHRLCYGEAGQAHDADALQGELQLRVALVDRKPAADLDLANFIFDAKGPAVEVGALARQDAFVAQQILRPPRRAVTCEIVG